MLLRTAVVTKESANAAKVTIPINFKLALLKICLGCFFTNESIVLIAIAATPAAAAPAIELQEDWLFVLLCHHVLCRRLVVKN